MGTPFLHTSIVDTIFADQERSSNQWSWKFLTLKVGRSVHSTTSRLPHGPRGLSMARWSISSVQSGSCERKSCRNTNVKGAPQLQPKPTVGDCLGKFRAKEAKFDTGPPGEDQIPECFPELVSVPAIPRSQIIDRPVELHKGKRL